MKEMAHIMLTENYILYSTALSIYCLSIFCLLKTRYDLILKMLNAFSQRHNLTSIIDDKFSDISAKYFMPTLYLHSICWKFCRISSLFSITNYDHCQSTTATPFLLDSLVFYSACPREKPIYKISSIIKLEMSI